MEVACTSQIGRCPSTARLPSHLSCRTFVQAESTVLQSPMALTQQPLLRLAVAMLILLGTVVCTGCEVDKKNGLGAAHSAVVLYEPILFGCYYLGRYPPGSCCRWTLVTGMGMVVVSIYRQKCCCGIALQRIYNVFGCGVATSGMESLQLGSEGAWRTVSSDEFRGVRWWCFYALRQVRHDDGRLPSAWAWQTKRNIQAQIQVRMIPHRIMTLTKDADSV